MANDDFTVQISKILSEYNEKVDRAMKEALPKIAKEATKKLKGSSPARKGTYAGGWRAKVSLSTVGVEAVVYNARKPGLPHLLERGHAKRGGGRTSPDVHIKPVEEWVKQEAVKAVEEAIQK